MDPTKALWCQTILSKNGAPSLRTVPRCPPVARASRTALPFPIAFSPSNYVRLRSLWKLQHMKIRCLNAFGELTFVCKCWRSCRVRAAEQHDHMDNLILSRRCLTAHMSHIRTYVPLCVHRTHNTKCILKFVRSQKKLEEALSREGQFCRCSKAPSLHEET